MERLYLISRVFRLNSHAFNRILCIGFCTIIFQSAASEELKVAASHLPPLLIISDDPNQPRYSGFDAELTEMIAKEMKMPVKMVECEWQSCLRHLRMGEIDIVHSILFSDLRNEFIDFLTPAYIEGKYNTVFYQRFDDPREINSVKDIISQEMIIGYLGSTVYFPEFESADSIIKLDVKNIDLGLRLLATKRIDALAGFEELLYDIESQRPTWLKLLKFGDFQPKANLRSFTALSRKSKHYQLKPELEKALQKITDDGKIEMLKAKWIKTVQ